MLDVPYCMKLYAVVALCCIIVLFLNVSLSPSSPHCKHYINALMYEADDQFYCNRAHPMTVFFFQIHLNTFETMFA